MSSAAAGHGRRYYLRHSQLPLDEGPKAEFKAHRCLSLMDLSTMRSAPGRDRSAGLHSKWRPRRSVISPHICGMLNSGGGGGTFYLGVTDCGIVEGFQMSKCQQDHFLLSLSDLMSSYSPPVPADRYRVEFVPVVDGDGWQPPAETLDGQISRDLPHEIRESRYCWYEDPIRHN